MTDETSEKVSIFPDSKETWGIVQLMGHQQLAGRLSEVSVAGSAMLRIDVPDPTDKTKFRTAIRGAGAVYGIDFVDETIARASAVAHNSRPIYEYEVQDAIRKLAAPKPSQRDAFRDRPIDNDDDDDDEDDED